MECNRNSKQRKGSLAKQEPKRAPKDPGSDLTPEQHEAQKEELERISARAQSSGID